jgi:hypothetical protein
LNAVHAPPHPGSLIAGVVIGVAGLWIRAKFDKRQSRPDPDGMVLGSRTYTFDRSGVRIERPHSSAFMDWSCCREVHIEGEHLFIWVDRVSAYMIPVRDLPSGMTPEDAAARVRAFADQGVAVSSTAPVPTLLPSEGAPSGQPALTERYGTLPRRQGPLARAFGFLLLRPGLAALPPPSDRAIACFAIFALGLWLLLDRLRYGSHAQFIPFEITGFAWYLLSGLLAVWATSRVTRPQVDFRSVLFLFVVVAPALITGAFLSDGGAATPKLQLAGVTAITVYLIVYMVVGLRKLTGRAQVPAVAVLVLLTSLLIGLNSAVYPTATLWMEDEPQDTQQPALTQHEAEGLLVSQPERIAAEAAKIVPAPSGTAAMYFVGFAGVGRQKVFAEEIKLAASRVAERYRAPNRSLLLLNDRRDVSSHPLATVSGLKLALKAVAARMHLEDDVLFLALSSHGSAEPALSVSNGPLPLVELTGPDLATALKDSGIKWKVIVISACHAGAFIDSLRDENTVILTAAAADRTSFGCSNDRDLTYFGEAFYRDALPKSASVRDAFEQAKMDIARRETAEGITASNPQGFFGSALEKKLAGFESRN